MTHDALSRYIDPEVLSQVADRHFEPRGLVIGNLAGAHKSPLSGFAVEFAGHREYAPGDDPKYIDWRVYFNRDKFFVKQYELETNLVCHLLLDISASMRYGEGKQQKLMYASLMATTLGYSIIRQADKVSLATFDTHVRGFVAPSNSMGQVVRMTQHLDGQTVTQHDYSGSEGAALHAGGVQRLYAGRLTEGEHRLDVSLSGRLGRNKAFQQQRSVTITKIPGRKYMELQLGPGEEKSQAGVTVREWQQ